MGTKSTTQTTCAQQAMYPWLIDTERRKTTVKATFHCKILIVNSQEMWVFYIGAFGLA